MSAAAPSAPSAAAAAAAAAAATAAAAAAARTGSAGAGIAAAAGAAANDWRNNGGLLQLILLSLLVRTAKSPKWRRLRGWDWNHGNRGTALNCKCVLMEGLGVCMILHLDLCDILLSVRLLGIRLVVNCHFKFGSNLISKIDGNVRHIIRAGATHARRCHCALRPFL